MINANHFPLIINCDLLTAKTGKRFLPPIP